MALVVPVTSVPAHLTQEITTPSVGSSGLIHIGTRYGSYYVRAANYSILPVKLVEDTQILDVYGYVLYNHSSSKSCQKDQNFPPVSLL